MTPDAPEALPVVVVGLGPVGAVLALALARQGVRVVVLERDRSEHALPRAAHLDGDALRVLAGLSDDRPSIADAVVATGHAIDGFRLVDARLRPLLHARQRPGAETGWPRARLIHQPTVERALRECLAQMPGAEVRLGHAVEHVEADADGVTVSGTVDGAPFEVRASYIVGCDGARSRVRDAMGAALAGGRFEQPWLVVDTLLRREIDLPEHLLQIADARRPATFVPFPGRRRWEFRLLAGETEAGMTHPDTIQRLLAQYVDTDAVEVERAAVYTFHDLVARPWRRGRLMLAGDAAHQMPPFLGQGIGAGVQDAATLAWVLALVWHGTAGDALLDTVEAERRPHVAAVTRLAVRLGRLVSAGGAAARIRDAVLRAARLVRLPTVSAPFPAVRPVLGRPPRAARVPNATLTTPDGRQVLLDAVLGPRFGIVGVGVDAHAWTGGVWDRLGAQVVTVDGPADGSLHDAEGVLTQWAGRTPAVVVVRPDRFAFGIYRPDEAGRAADDARRDLHLAG